MLYRKTVGAFAFAAALVMTIGLAQAFDDSKYPDWNGQWRRPPGVNNQWDPSKPRLNASGGGSSLWISEPK